MSVYELYLTKLFMYSSFSGTPIHQKTAEVTTSLFRYTTTSGLMDELDQKSVSTDSDALLIHTVNIHVNNHWSWV